MYKYLFGHRCHYGFNNCDKKIMSGKACKNHTCIEDKCKQAKMIDYPLMV